MAPEEGLEPTTLRLTALPDAFPMVPARPRRALLELDRPARDPRWSPPVPFLTQESAINPPSVDHLQSNKPESLDVSGATLIPSYPSW
jgi:hypothetical protein